jgi:hypothetical protein
MPAIHLVLASAEEAADGNAEFWCGHDLVGVTVLHEGRLHLRVDPRRDGEPWLMDTATLAAALADAQRQLALY